VAGFMEIELWNQSGPGHTGGLPDAGVTMFRNRTVYETDPRMKKCSTIDLPVSALPPPEWPTYLQTSGIEMIHGIECRICIGVMPEKQGVIKYAVIDDGPISWSTPYGSFDFLTFSSTLSEKEPRVSSMDCSAKGSLKEASDLGSFLGSFGSVCTEVSIV